MVHIEKGARRSSRSAGIAALLLSGVAGFQVALAAGAPWGAAAWGGANPGPPSYPPSSVAAFSR